MKRIGEGIWLLFLLVVSAGALNSVVAAEGQQPASTPDMATTAVETTPETDQKLAELNAALAGSESKRALYDRFLPALGAKAIIGLLEKRNRFCHSEAHDLGRAVMTLRGNVGTALEECGTGCFSACMHGVLLEAFGESSLGSLVANMNSFCAGPTVTDRYQEGSCAHGIGHALMFVTKRDVDASLNACRYFDEPAKQHYCATGVFMEHGSAPDSEAYEDVHGVCGRHTSFPAACYRYQASRIARELGGRDHLAAECETLPAPRRLGCFHGLGLLSRVLAGKDPTAFRQVCGEGSSDDRIMCIEGAIEKLADYDRDAALKVCEAIEGDLKVVCLDAARSGSYRATKPSLHLYASPEAIGEKLPLSADDAAPHEKHTH